MAVFATVNGTETEIIRRGTGRQLLLLHPEIGLAPDLPVLDLLARRFEVIAPSHPGFGRTPMPAGMTSVDDLSYFYLDLIEALGLDNLVLAGISFGGWLAAEIAVKGSSRIGPVVLANPAGIKTGSRTERDMVDIFSVTPKQLDALSFHDAKHVRHCDAQASEEEILIELRNRESTGRFAWSPYMHNPKLKGRLHRITQPSLVLWGTGDKLAPSSYGQTFAALLPQGRFEPVEGAGRYVHIEQPEAFAEKVAAFAGM